MKHYNAIIKHPVNDDGTSSDIYINLSEASPEVKALALYMEETLLAPDKLISTYELNTLVAKLDIIKKRHLVRLPGGKAASIMYRKYNASECWDLCVETPIDGYMTPLTAWFVTNKTAVVDQVDIVNQKREALKKSINSFLDRLHNSSYRVSFNDEIEVPSIYCVMEVLALEPEGYQDDEVKVRRLKEKQYFLSFKDNEGEQYSYTYVVDNTVI